jgi:HKD family nuclease
MKIQIKAQGLLGVGNALVVSLPPSFSLRKELLGATEIRLAAAFAHWSGWRSVRPHLGKAHKHVKLLTGLSFCQTEPRVLYDWWKLALRGQVEARLFVNRRVTFHPKVLIVYGPKRRFVVVGSGNLSAGGFLDNIECGLYSEDNQVVHRVSLWFYDLFENEDFTKELLDVDIRRYRPRYNKAREMNRAARAIQEGARDEIGERHRAELGKWKQAVASAKKFFADNDDGQYYLKKSDEIRSVLGYPAFDFNKDGLDKFYGIQELGHLIEINKVGVWRQRRKLRNALRYLVDDARPIRARLHEVLDPDGRYHVKGAALNFMSKVLAVHDSQQFAVFNRPVAGALSKFGYESDRGSASQKYLAFSALMRRFLTESGAPSMLDLDGFFFKYWEQHVKLQGKRGD